MLNINVRHKQMTKECNVSSIVSNDTMSSTNNARMCYQNNGLLLANQTKPILYQTTSSNFNSPQSLDWCPGIGAISSMLPLRLC